VSQLPHTLYAKFHIASAIVLRKGGALVTGWRQV